MRHGAGDAVILTAIVCFAIWAIAVVRLRIWRQWHHEWIGVILFIVGELLGWRWLAIVGLLVMADDAGQHAAQLRRPTFRSPLHLLYRHTLYRWWHP